jgi:anti-sigma factor RsiW
VTCREATGFLMDYLNGDLPADVQADFERHLDRCANCRAFLAQYRATVAAVKLTGAADVDPPAALPEELVQAVLNTLAKTS